MVFDTHWLVNAGYHINCAPHFEGLYTSNELPHFIANMEYGFPGNPELGRILAEGCNALGVETLAHDATTLGPEYGTLVPMRYMNQDRHFKVVSVSALCTVHYLNDSARLGWAMRKAVEEHYDGTVAFLASGSLSHRFAQNGQAPDFSDRIWSPFLEVLDHEVVQMWQEGRWAEFCGMLPEYASKGHGEGFMHDTAMLLGALGWSAYDGKAEVVTPYFGSSGTGQINAVFPVTAQDGSAIPAARRQPGRRQLRQPPLRTPPCRTSSPNTPTTSKPKPTCPACSRRSMPALAPAAFSRSAASAAAACAWTPGAWPTASTTTPSST